MKKCKKCNGMGFTFDKLMYVNHGIFGLRAVNKKQQCINCYGKGAR